MYCKNCYKMIDDDAEFCPACGASQKGKSSANRKPIYKKWWFWLIVVFAVFVLLPGGSDEPEIVGNGGESSIVKNDSSLTYIAPGQTADWDNILVTFNSVTQNNGTEWFVPTQGNVYVVCEFIIENNTDSELNISSIMCFDAYVDDYSIGISLSAESSVDKDTLDGAIAPGKKMRGIIGYEVPSNWDTLEIHFTPDFWSGKDFVFACTNKNIAPSDLSFEPTQPKINDTISTGSLISTSEKAALERAKDYLRISSFSRKGLEEQLEYDGFSEFDIAYAISELFVDWYEQAQGKALSYLKTSAFSYSGLIDQLEFEGFTSSEATYGADNCGADWNEQAAKRAKSYMKHSNFSRQELIDQLLYEGFTQAQSEYGAAAVGY